MWQREAGSRAEGSTQAGASGAAGREGHPSGQRRR